jgi:hypothetical protein
MGEYARGARRLVILRLRIVINLYSRKLDTACHNDAFARHS